MKKFILFIALIFVGTLVYAVNMPSGPVYDMKPSGISNDNVYKKKSVVNSSSSSNNIYGSCPNYSDFKVIMENYSVKIKKVENDDQKGRQLFDVMANHLSSIFRNCKKYVQTVPNPDCSKVDTLSCSAVLVSMSSGIVTQSDLDIIEAHVNRCEAENDYEDEDDEDE